MDVFGTVTSIISLIGTIVNYLQAVRSAEEDCLKLLSEASALGALLGILRRRLDDTNTNGSDGGVPNTLVKAGIQVSLGQCYQDLAFIVSKLKPATSKSGNRNSWWLPGGIQKLKWPFHQGEITTTLGKIERLKSLISLAFQTSLMEFIDQTRGELAVVGLNVEEVKSTVLALEADHSAHMKRVEVNLQVLGFALQDSTDGIMNIENTVTAIDRNQRDQMVKGSLMQADLAIVKEGKELQDILEWLSPLDFEGKHVVAFEKHTSGTGAWFLGHPKFRAWRRGEHSMLWCPGNPGVGKSVMSSLVVHQLRRNISEDMAVVFIYFEYTTKYTMTQLLEAILKQLIRRHITNSGMKVLKKHKTGNRPTFRELLAILTAELKAYTRVFVVVDALDEADGQIWVPLLECLRVLPGISVLATSRDLGDIAAEFHQDQRLDVMADEEDMRRYIEGRLSCSTGTLRRLLEEHPSLYEEIVTGIMRKADGMFLLARLHMNLVETKPRLRDLRQALSELPSDLKTTYDEAMARIGDQNKGLACRIFSWLIHAARPLTISDLQYALAVEDGMTSIDAHDLYDEAHLTSICVGLVTLQDGQGPSGGYNSLGKVQVVGLVHYTTQEYFLHDHEVLTHFPHPNHLAVTCLRYLSFDIFNQPLDEGSRDQLMMTPFVYYAVNSWGEHAHKHSDDPVVHKLVMELLHDDRKVEFLGFIFCNARNVSAVQLCTHLGLKHYLECLLDDGFDINSKDSDGDTAVTEAAIHGQDEIMRLLLQREGVDVGPNGWNGTIPLTRAVIHGHQGIVKLLLARDDVDANWHDHEGITPLAHAAEQGHSDIAKLLLERDDVKINTQDRYGYTPLASAVVGGYEAIVRLLLAREDLDLCLRNSFRETNLTLAAASGNERIVEMLLAKGIIDINSKDKSHKFTALSEAARRGHEAVVKVLLASDGIDVNSVDSVGYTPLDRAEIGEYQGVVELLQAAGGRTSAELRVEFESARAENQGLH